MLGAIKYHVTKFVQDFFHSKPTSKEWKKIENEFARLKRNIVYYEVQHSELKKALGLEYTSSYKELLEMAKDPANHKWNANSELITILAAAIKRSADQTIYFAQEELESANGDGIEVRWDTEKNCARVTLTAKEDLSAYQR